MTRNNQINSLRDAIKVCTKYSDDRLDSMDLEQLRDAYSNVRETISACTFEIVGIKGLLISLLNEDKYKGEFSCAVEEYLSWSNTRDELRKLAEKIMDKGERFLVIEEDTSEKEVEQPVEEMPNDEIIDDEIIEDEVEEPVEELNGRTFKVGQTVWCDWDDYNGGKVTKVTKCFVWVAFDWGTEKRKIRKDERGNEYVEFLDGSASVNYRPAE